MANTELDQYNLKKKSASKLIYLINELMLNKGVELVFFRNHLIDQSAPEIISLHGYARNVVKEEMTIHDTLEITEHLQDVDLKPSKIDVGKLTSEWIAAKKDYADVTAFLHDKLDYLMQELIDDIASRDVVLFGFGRIGRLAARELIYQAGKGQQLRLKAIVVRKIDEKALDKRAELLRNDSVHGTFEGSIEVDYSDWSIIANGQRIKFIVSSDPASIDYTAYGINDAILIDNTGIFRDDVSLANHLKANGISKVLLTAPAKGDVPNVVYGINHKELDLDGVEIYSAASCTTNAICPILKVINDNLGIEKGHIETIHAYTNDQNLLDNMHKKYRRGRSAAINMVLTETGAGKAVSKVIPELSGILTANAVRVPTPNGSLAIMNLTLKKEVTLEEVNNVIRENSLKGDLVNQIFYSYNPETVSNDIIGNSCCSVFDSPATIVSNDKRNVVLYTWYDNEFGYTKQVIRFAKFIAKVRRRIYY